MLKSIKQTIETKSIYQTKCIVSMINTVKIEICVTLPLASSAVWFVQQRLLNNIDFPTPIVPIITAIGL